MEVSYRIMSLRTSISNLSCLGGGEWILITRDYTGGHWIKKE